MIVDEKIIKRREDEKNKIKATYDELTQDESKKEKYNYIKMDSIFLRD